MWPTARFSRDDVPDRVVERALANVATEGDCIVSLYSRGSHGYAQIGWSAGGEIQTLLIHRIAYVHYIGPIDAGLTVDHVCRNRPCLNPAHLRLLPNSCNASDNGQVRTSPTSGKTCRVCGEQKAVSNGRHYCRACNNRRTRALRREKRRQRNSVAF